MKAILAELDKMGPADEAKLKQWLPANFKRHGIAADRIKKVTVLPRNKEMKEIGIVLLTKPEDEAAAIAATVKSSKSNSSDSDQSAADTGWSRSGVQPGGQAGAHWGLASVGSPGIVRAVVRHSP